MGEVLLPLTPDKSSRSACHLRVLREDRCLRSVSHSLVESQADPLVGSHSFPLTSYGRDLTPILPKESSLGNAGSLSFTFFMALLVFCNIFYEFSSLPTHWPGTYVSHTCSGLCNNKSLIKWLLNLRFLFIVWSGLKTIGFFHCGEVDGFLEDLMGTVWRQRLPLTIVFTLSAFLSGLKKNNKSKYLVFVPTS